MWLLGNFTWTCRHWSLDLWTLLIHIVLADIDWLERFGAPLRPQSLDLDFVCICWVACQRLLCQICSQEGGRDISYVTVFQCQHRFASVRGTHLLTKSAINVVFNGFPLKRWVSYKILWWKNWPPLSNHVQCLNAWLAYLQALDTKAVKNTSYFFRKMLWIVLGRKIVLYM